MIDKSKIIELVEKRIKTLNSGCYLVDVSISDNNKITVEVDNEKRGISIEECAAISRNIEHNLNREEEDFELMVTSPGLDKPFKVDKQYLKNIGRTVKVKTKNNKEIIGELKAVEDETIVIKEKRNKKNEINEHIINKKDIESTKIIISFK